MVPDYIFEQFNEATPGTLFNDQDSVDENNLNSIQTDDQNNDPLATTMKKLQTISGSIEVNSTKRPIDFHNKDKSGGEPVAHHP